MGLKLFSDSCSCSGGYSQTVLPNPNPFRFTIERAVDVGGFCVAQIRYPDCINFDGVKILILRGYSVDDLHLRTEIDPHFIAGNGVVARICPGPDGFDMAVKVAEMLSENFY